jgi:hypothetical protein
MTMIVHYQTKKDLKAAVGQPLKYAETFIFGEEYRSNGTFTVSRRHPPRWRPGVLRVGHHERRADL